MSETMKYAFTKSLRWIWIALLAALVCTVGFHFLYNGGKTGEEDLEVQRIQEYSGDWIACPEAHRYAVYRIELMPQTEGTPDAQSEDPIAYLNRYIELIRQNIMSIENVNYIYQSLADRFDGVFENYSSFEMVEEMLPVYSIDASTLVICVNAPRSLNRDQSGARLKDPLYTDAEICGMRDYVYSLMEDVIEKNEYIHSFPVKMSRIARASEDTLSEQSLLVDRFSRQETEKEPAGPSVKKLLVLFIAVFCLAWACILAVIMGNGKIKTGEELERVTNLTVYRDFLLMDYDQAAVSVSAKLSSLNLQGNTYLLYLPGEQEISTKIAGDLRGEFSLVPQIWRENESLAPLKNKNYLLVVEQNKTGKRELKYLARELAQIHALCQGAIIV